MIPFEAAFTKETGGELNAMLYQDHSHPLVHAGFITSRALKAVENERFKARNTRERKRIDRAIDLTERVHTRIAEQIKITPEAWKDSGVTITPKGGL